MDPLNSPTAMPLEGPIAVMLTFSTYGTWLHGDRRGSVDWNHNEPGTSQLMPCPKLESWERDRLKFPPMEFEAEQRRVVMEAIQELIARRGWTMIALNVLTCHAHTELNVAKDPKRMIADIKAWATHRLVEAGLVEANRRVWTRGGSYRLLWTPEQVSRTALYIVEGQGAYKGVYGEVPII